jgi:hypothetical protein
MFIKTLPVRQYLHKVLASDLPDLRLKLPPLLKAALRFQVQ